MYVLRENLLSRGGGDSAPFNFRFLFDPHNEVGFAILHLYTPGLNRAGGITNLLLVDQGLEGRDNSVMSPVGGVQVGIPPSDITCLPSDLGGTTELLCHVID